MTLREINESNLTPEIAQRAEILFAQLTDAKKPVPLHELISGNTALTLLGCFEGESLCGMASLATYIVPSGKKGWIEDVVVDHSQRGRGIGRELMQRLVEKAVDLGCSELLLFTGFARRPAIALYESLGFIRKESHLYSMRLKNP